ncbi:hypothetical protein QFZ31_006698 [Neobacillus niacini]|uniref:hypothetical protein n=1 Tax=Neobacillus driksii TaxID=3035913 RepID=UPI002782B57C|nr:hypothetical protein [Neobacillus niacini]MDQ0976646.1 hypothetical protein [Neobacillus niacini]
MNNELTKFKRYCELLEITYSMKRKATGDELAELGKLSYDLKLTGVPDVIAEMNFYRLEKELEKAGQ